MREKYLGFELFTLTKSFLFIIARKVKERQKKFNPFEASECQIFCQRFGSSLKEKNRYYSVQIKEGDQRNSLIERS